jgi:predicted butyrate kinase (DUF1464 family)
MPRVIGIDPGTLSLDLCGLDDTGLFLDRSLPTADALADGSALVAFLEGFAPLDLVAGPSGYGLPLVSARDATESDLRLACLAPEGEGGGIGGLRTLMRALARSTVPVVFTPGVVHLQTVPGHRKVNRVDMGTADKLCAAALAIHDEAARHGRRERDVSLILLELGGAFTAAIGVEGGAIVDGIGGSSGPIGLRAAGALDGEVAFLAGSIHKATLFRGGVHTIAGGAGDPAAIVGAPAGERERLASEAYLEGAVKAVAALRVAVPRPQAVILSGRLARARRIRDELSHRLRSVAGDVPVRELSGFASVAGQAAQGAALLAHGLAGGRSAALVEALGLRTARGSVLDHLYVVSPEAAMRRLGLS